MVSTQPNTDTSHPHGLQQWKEAFSRASDIEFRELLEHLPAGAYTCDAEGLITYYNQRAVEVWGRSPKLNDPVDRWCGSFKLYAADGAPLQHQDCWMGLAIRENRGYNAEEIIVERPNGERLTVLAHANPLHDDDGRVTGAVNVLVDISERKQDEARLIEAQRANREFLAMLAHELRNPLAPMQNALRIMRLSGDDDDAVDHARGVLERQLLHLARVVDDLVDVSRITRNRLELRTDRVELGAIINQAIETSRPLADAMQHEVTVSLPVEPVYLQADAVRLAQVFTNLLRNAAKYTDARGRIRIAVERQGSDALVSVRDSGIGMTPEQLAVIFQMFTRAAAGNDSRGGLGIGLTLARRLVELHGGTIEARSDGLGRGSEFSVRLPIIIDAPRPVRAVPAEPEPHATDARVLVVDDNVDAADSLAELLQLIGSETHVAHDGQQAIEMAEALRPDLIFLDIGLPRMDGYEVARRIRSTEWGAGTRLVALTGWGQAEDRARSEAAGIDEHLVKPVDFGVLEGLVEAVSA